MPFKNPEDRAKYIKEYMQKRRAREKALAEADKATNPTNLGKPSAGIEAIPSWLWLVLVGAVVFLAMAAIYVYA